MKFTIKILIWLYIVLLIVEGALRKWVFPSLSNPLLVVRDPVILIIYALALSSGLFPGGRWVIVTAVLAVLSIIAFFLGGHDQLVVLAYGIRINYLHLPLIWIMGKVLDRRDVENIGTALLLVAIPMTLIMVQQFRSPMDSFINRGVGEDEVGQIFGADGRIRPPGLFSFITGPQLFYPLCAAFFFDQLGTGKRLPWYILLGCGLAIAVALPVSISRTAMLATGIVGVAFVFSLRFISTQASSLFRSLLLFGILTVALSQLPVFREGTEVFMMRWNNAAAEMETTAWGGVVDRGISGLTNPFYFIQQAPFLGHGVGTGSNVGARLMSGELGFLLAEEEWGKILLELGPVLGVAFIGFRIALTLRFAWLAWKALREEKNNLPLLIFAAVSTAVLQGQWAPPTILGFAVAGSGLFLGALNPRTKGDPSRTQSLASRKEPRPRTGSIPSGLPVPSSRRLPVVPRKLTP